MNDFGYATTGFNPHMSIYQFQGVGDYKTLALWWEIMSCGPCLDAPLCVPVGACTNSGAMYIEPRR